MGRARCPKGHAVARGTMICPSCLEAVVEPRLDASVRRAGRAGIRMIGLVLGGIAAALLLSGVLLLPWITVDLPGSDLLCIGAGGAARTNPRVVCDGSTATLVQHRVEVAALLRSDPGPMSAVTRAFTDWGALVVSVSLAAAIVVGLVRRSTWVLVGIGAAVGASWSLWSTIEFARHLPFDGLGIGLHATWIGCVLLMVGTHLVLRRQRDRPRRTTARAAAVRDLTGSPG